MMLSNQSDIQMIGRLLALLDEQIVLLDNRLAILKGLGQATAAYDNQAMETLLARMEQAMLAQAAHDKALRAVRGDWPRPWVGPCATPAYPRWQRSWTKTSPPNFTRATEAHRTRRAIRQLTCTWCCCLRNV